MDQRTKRSTPWFGPACRFGPWMSGPPVRGRWDLVRIFSARSVVREIGPKLFGPVRTFMDSMRISLMQFWIDRIRKSWKIRIPIDHKKSWMSPIFTSDTKKFRFIRFLSFSIFQIIDFNRSWMITNLATLSRSVTANNFRKNSLIVNCSDFDLSPGAHRKPSELWNITNESHFMSHTIPCPVWSDRRQLRHVQTSQ